MASGESLFLMKFIISSSRSGLGVNPGLRVMNAFTTSMFISSGLDVTADSPTAGCSSRADSTSNGLTRCPPVLITSSSRPMNQ
ncbi:MAG: hypothetical protein MZV63_48420 [Marinilabiliales bacterium]|nr:hypothetical protein [Marinilabiliales bacterium]